MPDRAVIATGAALLAGAAATFGVVAASRARQQPPPTTSAAVPLVTGTDLTPLGTQTDVGSYPVNAILSLDGRWIVVSNIGSRSYLTVLDVRDGRQVSQVPFNGPHPFADGKKEGLFYGLTWGATTPQGTLLYAGRGSDERIGVLTLSPEGKLSREERTIDTPSGVTQGQPLHHVAGLAVSADGTTLYAANNAGDPKKGMNSTLSVIDLPTARLSASIPLPGYPLGVAAMTTGPSEKRKVYVGSEQRGVVAVVDPMQKKVIRTVSTGAQPTGMIFDRAQARLFVANASSDTVSIIRTRDDKVEKSILLRPADARGLPGATPTGLALSPDEKTLFVTLSDMNAVALVNVEKGRVEGYLPVGWYPTAVIASPDGGRLFVTNAKGVAARNPNGKPKAGLTERPRYIQNIIEGTVSTIDLAATRRDLPRHTAQVLENNRVRPDLLKMARKALKNPGIEHVIYIIKENRTYDQVLSDLPQGNGDQSLLMFGREVTPNQHALAERFVLLDNFYCCAEVSGDGWNWSTQGVANSYTSRNVVYGYGGRNRTYDYEGANNGVPVDRLGIPDVSRTQGGYIWDACARKSVSFRNYGFFLDDFSLPRPSAEEGTTGLQNEPNKKALVGKHDPNFRQYDTSYADSEAWVKHAVTAAPRQRKSFGQHNDPARMTAWLREFQQFVKDGNLPRFQMVRLGRDHTAGTTAGQSSPRAMVADNDYAVGQLVEAVSKSPYWKKTAIFIVEDDAQNGYDHVDAHRTIAFVVSPFIRKGTVDSRFYNTDSMLHTMENLLGLDPLNLYDAIAPALAVFTDKAGNDAPYEAILPTREIIAEVNGQRAYRSRDSERLLNPLQEESAPDEELNDILWHAIKGEHVPAPPRVYGLRTRPEVEDD